MPPNKRQAAVEALQQQLGYQFHNRELLESALTHASVSRSAVRAPSSYERLEFLGDRVLGLVIAEHLMRTRPSADENSMSRHFHTLVEGAACARVARSIGLGAALRMGGGETRNGLRSNATVLGDVMEAVLAAIYFDGGLEAAKDVILRIWDGELKKEPPSEARANVKLALQTWALSKGAGIPKYELLDRRGPAHESIFTVEAKVDGVDPVRAEGRSRQEAEKAAATAMLTREGLL